MEAVTIKRISEEELAKELRIQYIQPPPEGMASNEVRDMSDEDLWDMDYFLHEFDNIDDDDWGWKGVISFNLLTVCFLPLPLQGYLFTQFMIQKKFPIKKNTECWGVLNNTLPTFFSL